MTTLFDEPAVPASEKQSYTVVEMKVGERTVYAIRFTADPYCGLLFSYGAVQFVENESDALTIKYEYNVHEGLNEPYDKDDLERHLGDFLTSLILEQLNTQQLIYTGGVDGTNYTEQLDSQREIPEEGFTIPY